MIHTWPLSIPGHLHFQILAVSFIFRRRFCIADPAWTECSLKSLIEFWKRAEGTQSMTEGSPVQLHCSSGTYVDSLPYGIQLLLVWVHGFHQTFHVPSRTKSKGSWCKTKAEAEIASVVLGPPLVCGSYWNRHHFLRQQHLTPWVLDVSIVSPRRLTFSCAASVLMIFQIQIVIWPQAFK